MGAVKLDEEKKGVKRSEEGIKLKERERRLMVKSGVVESASVCVCVYI